MLCARGDPVKGSITLRSNWSRAFCVSVCHASGYLLMQLVTLVRYFLAFGDGESAKLHGQDCVSTVLGQVELVGECSSCLLGGWCGRNQLKYLIAVLASGSDCVE